MQAINSKLQQAIQFHQSGQLNEAEKLYKELITEGNPDTSVYSSLSAALSQQGKIDEAIELLKSASNEFPNDTEITLALSQAYLSTGDIVNSKQLINSLLLRFPSLGNAHYLLGNIHIQENNKDQAILSFEKAIESLPQFVEAHYSLGVVLSQKGENEKAIEKWEHTIKLAPNFLPSWLNLGSLAMDQSRFEDAIRYLDQVLSFDPEHFSAIKMKGMTLHAMGEIDDALELYLKIHNKEKPSEEIITLIANANRDLDRFEEAGKFYNQVLDINPNNSIAKENIEKFESKRIDGWLMSMLADLKRNDGYAESIKRTIQRGDTVLDIGTGSGLLSMMCAREGAKKIYTCETIKVIADVAKVISADNNYQEQIEVFHAKSNKLKIGREIPQKVDALVSEIFDAGLLGEGVLPSLRHAQANLLKEGAKIIPAAADIKAVLVQSNHLKKTGKIKEVSGFDLSSFGKFQVDDSYKTIVLSNIPHLKLSDEFKPLSIDFHNLPKATSPQSPNVHTINVEITTDGEIDAVVFWFDLHFDDELTLSSGPEKEMIHWGQAVECFDKPRKVKAGDIISLTVEQSETNVVFKHL